MCILLLSLGSHEGYKVVALVNRDEFLDRPTLPAHYWSDMPEILGGARHKSRPVLPTRHLLS